MSAIEPFFFALRDADAVALHLRAGEAPGWRVDGRIVPNGDPLPPTEDFDKLLLDLVAEAGKIEQFREQSEFDFAHECANMRFRVHIYRTPEGRNAVISKIQRDALEGGRLGLPGVVGDAIRSARGIVIVAGADGSGRRTTVASLLDTVNQESSRYLVSIEQPVTLDLEAGSSILHQLQVGDDTPTFAAGVGTAMAAHANVIAVGAVEDVESARLVVRAAEAGALVIAALTAHSVTDALGRMLELVPAAEHGFYRSCLAENLRFAMFQQLLPAKAGGRVAAFEFVAGTPEVGLLVRENRVVDLPRLIADQPKSRRYQSLDRSIEQLLKTDQIERDLAVCMTRDRRALERK